MSALPPVPLLMAVEDVLGRGRGPLVVVRVERGQLRAGDIVAVVGLGGDGVARVTEVEAFGRRVDTAGAGMNVGLLLDIPGCPVERGQVLAAPGSIAAHTRFTADISVLPDSAGTTELGEGALLQAHIRTAAVPGEVGLPPGADAIAPCHGGTVTLTLARPVALEVGTRFAFRHRGRAAGQGTVTALPTSR